MVPVIVAACARSGNRSDEKDHSQDAKVFLGMSVPDLSALPPCDTGQANRIVYVVAEKGFRMCEKDRPDGEWSVVTVGGGTTVSPPPAPSPLPSPSAEDTYQKAFALYGKYRASVMRTFLTCSSGSGSTSKEYSQGTAFMCGPQTLCTNLHVVTCPTKGYVPAQLEVHRLGGERDSVTNPDAGGELPAPVLIVNGASIGDWIVEHPSRDLAKIRAPASSETVTTVPDAPVIPVATRPYTETAKTLSWVLTMGFPLGFTELYTDLGRVNSNTYPVCSPDGDIDCLKRKLDFSTSNDTDFGSSGSPLLNLDGEVIGIVTAGLVGKSANFTYAIDASLVSGF